MLLTLILSAVVIYAAIVIGYMCKACKRCPRNVYHDCEKECPMEKGKE